MTAECQTQQRNQATTPKLSTANSNDLEKRHNDLFQAFWENLQNRARRAMTGWRNRVEAGERSHRQLREGEPGSSMAPNYWPTLTYPGPPQPSGDSPLQPSRDPTRNKKPSPQGKQGRLLNCNSPRQAAAAAPT
ncbi:Hypothetical predicted protein [Pelobates cultripes]|uniref:Uncharacterized protein n=1 Tax=Pelobates cultripes TaxID=61616 RepID=A0AAD1R359_PELCU|nr:Hypothetical predicted protein [Pelobates cultripes]